jgi:soluble lytic murein transglycosylase-like protein
VAREEGLGWPGQQALLDPQFNLRVGLKYLSQLEERLGDVHSALAAYNLGPTRVARMSRERVRQNNYLRRVLSRYEDLVQRYA